MGRSSKHGGGQHWGRGEAALHCLVRKHIVKNYMSTASLNPLQCLSKLEICQYIEENLREAVKD